MVNYWMVHIDKTESADNHKKRLRVLSCKIYCICSSYYNYIVFSNMSVLMILIQKQKLVDAAWEDKKEILLNLWTVEV